MNWLDEPYIGYQIRLVAEFVGEDGQSFCEPVESMYADADRHFWGLYGKLPNGGVEHIGDYKLQRNAVQIYNRITSRAMPLEIIPELDPLELKREREHVYWKYDYYELSGFLDDKREVLFGSFLLEQVREEYESEVESLKDQGYTGITVTCRTTDDTPNPDVYTPEEIAGMNKTFCR